MLYRILVTGSRAWPYPNTVRHALTYEIAANKETYTQFVLIHGGSPLGGADQQADFVWECFRSAKVPVDILPAEVYPYGKYGTARQRNQMMVNLGANVCLAFATQWESGTGMTARMARRAGIRVRDYGIDTN
jgi:hypothetical protein